MTLTQVVAANETASGSFFCFKPLGHDLRLLLRIELSDGLRVVEAMQKTLHAILLKNNFPQVVRFHDFAAEFGSGSVREPKVLLLERSEQKTEFPLLAGPVKSGPNHFAFLDAVFFKFRIPADTVRIEQLGIYKYRPDTNKWIYVFTQPDREKGYLQCRVLTAGTYALLRDIFPPAIFFRRPESMVLQKLKRLLVGLRDLGQGIDETTVAVFLNGHGVDAEYDPDRDHVQIDDLRYLLKGKNHLLLRAKDRAGNPNEKQFTFSLH